MGPADIEQWAREFYPMFDRQGLIIDVRHNRGGNIDSWLLAKLLRKAWFYWQPRVGDPYWNMQYAFRGHIVVLCDQLTASDGEAFAEGFRRLGLGKVIGTRTWGGEIWLSSSNVLADRGIATAAEYGVYGPEGKWLIEGHGVDPDIVVDNLPHATFAGGDAQLDAAVKYLQDEIKKDPRPCRRRRSIRIRRSSTNRPELLSRRGCTRRCVRLQVGVVVIRSDEPHAAILEVGEEFRVLRGVQLARPQNFGVVDLRSVVHPLIVNVVLVFRAVAHQDQVLTRRLRKLFGDDLTADVAFARPDQRIANVMHGGRGCVERKSENESARERETDGTRADPHRSQVADRLHDQEKDRGGERRGVVRVGPDHDTRRRPMPSAMLTSGKRILRSRSAKGSPGSASNNPGQKYVTPQRKIFSQVTRRMSARVMW